MARAPCARPRWAGLGWAGLEQRAHPPRQVDGRQTKCRLLRLMSVAAPVIAKLLEKYRWIAWVGLLVILYVAASMI